MAAFNSPVWFNVGFEEQPQCSAACFILSVEDDLESILDWNTKEGKIFRGGSGSGINLSKIRGSKEHLSKGGFASGPVSFMRGADAWAGTIKSGGKTRRAAKMVVLDVDHPDILDFIWCKAREEEKAAALRDAGFDMRLDSEHFASIQYQNANNSVRVTDEFMERAEHGEEWELTARNGGEAIDRVDARDLLAQIADAAWRCADPGVQYDTTINEWHTCPNSGRINASNPCSRLESLLDSRAAALRAARGVATERRSSSLERKSTLREPYHDAEYMHVDDSACNLASLNLMKFRRPDGSFDVESFEHAVDVVILAQEIVVGPSSYPTEEIGRNARAFRQLGLGYANLGALLMANGVAYDSDEGRTLCGAITALMTGRAYRTSAEVAGGDRPVRALRGEPRPAQPRDAQAPARGVLDRRRAVHRRRAARRGAAGLGRGRRRGRPQRLPQRAGDGARPHGLPRRRQPRDRRAGDSCACAASAIRPATSGRTSM